MERRDSIIDAACSTIVEVGIAQLTVADVAQRADISSGLVHYHFRTKQQLLTAACERLAARRAGARAAALAADGLPALDALWSALRDGAESAAERACTDLALLGRRDPDVRRALATQRREELRALTARLPTLLGSLGSAPAAPPEEMAALVVQFLDGTALALASGTSAAEVRAAYDAFWLVLVTAGQARQR